MSQPKDYQDQTDPNHRQRYYPSNTANSGNSRSGGGRDGRLDTWLQGLVLAGILALVGIVWTLRDEVTKITSFVTLKQEQYERDISRIDKTIERHDQRLTSLEQGGRPRQPYPDYRQER